MWYHQRMAPLLPTFERLPCATVQLLHELPDGSWHIDWMIARDPDGAQPLISFRLASRVDELDPHERISTTRLADHRPAYLDYEGPISGNRGEVRRLCAGHIIAAGVDDEKLVLKTQWERPAGWVFVQSLQLSPHHADQWMLRCTANELQCDWTTPFVKEPP
jgi:hypothetical protein